MIFPLPLFLYEKLDPWDVHQVLGLTGLLGNSSCAESPFGGVKMSGYGKEAGKDVAIEEYLVHKTGTLTVDDLPRPQ